MQGAGPDGGLARVDARGPDLDQDFVSGLRSPLVGRALDYDSDAAVWSAVVKEPGLAVVAGPAVGPGLDSRP